MKKVIQIGNRTITEVEILTLLGGYQMLPLLWRELIIDRAIAPIELTNSEKVNAFKQFDERYQLTSLAERSSWGERYGMTIEQLAALAIREVKVEKFKYAIDSDLSNSLQLFGLGSSIAFVF